MNDEFWEWVESHSDESPARLRLARRPGRDPEWIDSAILQVECRRKYASKLPDELSCPRFYFPNALVAQQSTSDAIARIHAGMVNPGCRVVDLTAGLGVDVFHMTRKGAEVTAVEIDPTSAVALRDNAVSLGLGLVEVVNADCRQWILKAASDSYDVAFIDPARRGSDGERLYSLSDCQPDVLGMIGDVARVASRLIVKTSPMLDVANTIRELPRAVAVYAVGTSTECKEILVDVALGDNPVAEPVIHAMTPTYDFAFTRSEEAEAASRIEYGMPKPGDFLYEPSAVAMKAAPWGLLASRFGLKKLHANTHLYFSSIRQKGFPGVVRQIEEVLPYSSGVIKRFSRRWSNCATAVRNFPLTADALRARLGVKEGGDVVGVRVIGATSEGAEKPVLIVCRLD